MTATSPPPPAQPASAPADADGSTEPGGRRRAGSRLLGVDVARALAIVGMVAVHVHPSADQPVPGLYGWPYGRASTLFAVVAGVGIALLAARRPTRVVRARLAYRAAWLLPVGILLQRFPGHPVAVILQAYALWFLLAALVVGLSSRALLAVTSVGVLVGPTALVAAKVLRPGWFAPRGLADDAGVLGDVVLTGYYPTVSWWWLVLAGVLVGRLDLRRTSTAAGLLAGGAAVAAVTFLGAGLLRATVSLGRWQGLLDTEGHADTTLETLANGGIAVAVVGACLLLAAAVPAVLVAPLVSVGRLALTIYVGHIVVYGLTDELLLSRTLDEAVRTLGLFTLVVLAGSTLWLAVAPRGPLEALERSVFERGVRPLLRERARP